MWVSSFARERDTPTAAAIAATATAHDTANSNITSLSVRAHVWGSDRATAAPATHDTEHDDELAHATYSRVMLSPDDALTLAMTADINVLRQLKIVNGSYVCVRLLDQDAHAHIAKLVLVDAATAYSASSNATLPQSTVDASAHTVIGDITLSPLLAFNIGIPLHASTTDHVTAMLSIRAALPHELGLDATPTPGAFRRKHQEQPALALHATIAPLLVSSLASRNHVRMQQRDGLLDAIRACFATAQVLQAGDTFAVALRETSPAPGGCKASAAPQHLPYSTVAIPPSYFTESTSTDNSYLVENTDSTAASNSVVVLPPVLAVDTSLVFFRVEKLEGGSSSGVGCDALPHALALSVSESTELLQATTVSAAAAPDEVVVQRFAAFCEASARSPQSLLSTNSLPPLAAPLLPTNALAQLYEMLYPSQVCDVPVSVLLSGARGVGKTTLVHQVAQQLGVSVVDVPFTQLTGGSELELLANVREQVARAQALSPCLLYISRFFAVEHDNDDAALRLGAVFAECMHQLSLGPTQHQISTTPTHRQRSIPLLACVEELSDVPKFIRQSFLYELTLEAPDLAARRLFFQHASATTAFGPDVDVRALAQATAGRTCGELTSLIADAGALAVDRLLATADDDSDSSLIERLAVADVDTDGDPLDVSISAADLDAALKRQQALASASKVGAATIPNVKWSDVGGLEDVKHEILDVVQLPLTHPELFASGVRQRSGILLYGPPGTGKTLLAKAIATECQLNFLSVKGPELLNMYIGESEKNVRQVFAKARSCRPCVLFFDELDSLAPMRGRGSDSGGVMDRVVSQLLTEIDGLSGGGNDQVFVIGATNRPDLLETGLLRPGRFDRLLYLGICNAKTAQRKVVDALTRKFTLGPDVDLDAVVAQCPLNFTGADFYALCSSALSAALKDRVAAIDKQIDEINAADCYSSSPMTVRTLLSRLPPHELQVPVAHEHFITALQTVVPSVSPAELQHYERLKEQYSSKQDK